MFNRTILKTTFFHSILMIFLFTFSCCTQLFACSCIGQRTVEEEVKHSDVVVVGIILNVKNIKITDATMRKSSYNSITLARYELLIKDLYKGKIMTDTLIIYTGIGNGDCGMIFEIGENYIVYGEAKTQFTRANDDNKFRMEKNSFWTHTCLRTTFYSNDEINKVKKYVRKQKHKKT